ncbi:cupin domain-containing protein [Paenarthrobacter sp. NPDC092416]|uniref:cupin domain-containing protein n=1 Tax=Paenarthrobacter sp. NPDC092416 TaxID=3364386 RepID=UPI00382C5C05
MSKAIDATTAELEELIDSSIASLESRIVDFDTLKFQTKMGEKFRRGQVRYIGSGATGDHSDDNNILQAEHFTFSNMVLPAGCVGPEHTHPDVEEVFFVLEGRVEFSVHDVEDGNKMASRELGYRDLIRVPAGVPRSLRTIGDQDAIICVIIGAKKPEIPFYPPTSEMHGVTR